MFHSPSLILTVVSTKWVTFAFHVTVTEDGGCNVCQNIETTWQYTMAKCQNPKLHRVIIISGDKSSTLQWLCFYLNLARCGKMSLPSALTKPSCSFQASRGCEGSTASSATLNSSVHSGCGRPSSSYSKSRMPFCNHSTNNSVLEWRQSLLELQIFRDFLWFSSIFPS